MLLHGTGVEVEDVDGRRTATVGEMVNYLKYIYTNGEDSEGSVIPGTAPLQVFMQIKCDEAPALLTFDPDTLKAKAIIQKGDKIVETTPQQFELEAGCHARKWRNSFKVQGMQAVHYFKMLVCIDRSC